MKKISKYLLTIFLFCSVQFAHAQNEWIKIYGDDRHNVVREIIETYDGGYLLGGHTKYTSNQNMKQGLLIKTDINGVVLWEKTIGTESDIGTDGTFVSQTFDGGYILSSATSKYGSIDVMLMKLNACGEKEWNKIFVNNAQPQFPAEVVQMPDSSYLVMLSYWGNDLANERIWLFKVSPNGDIIWQKVYANWTPGTNTEEGYHLIKGCNNEYLITGDYYQYNPGEDTNHRWVRPMFIKIDSLGNEVWHLLWGVEEYYYGVAGMSKFNFSGNIYGVGTNDSENPPGYQGALFKLDADGNQLLQKNIPDSTMKGIATTISIMQDTALFIGTSWADWEDNKHTTVYKTDTLGNILAQKELLQEPNTFTSSIVTHDNKYLVTGNFVGGGNWDIYLWKFNHDLEYDSIYAQPRVYDSLCTYPIVSDTIDLDTTTVNLPELYKQMHHMQVRPNPAMNKLHFTLGDLVNGTEIRLYNTSGNKVKTLNLVSGVKAYTMDISTLPPGLYVAVLLNIGRINDKLKVVISR